MARGYDQNMEGDHERDIDRAPRETEGRPRRPAPDLPEEQQAMIRADGFDPTDDESYQTWRRMNAVTKMDERSTKREEFDSEVSTGLARHERSLAMNRSLAGNLSKPPSSCGFDPTGPPYVCCAWRA